MRLLFALILISSFAFAQKVDTLKIPHTQAQKIEGVEKQLKELETVKQQIQALEVIKSQLIEAAFDYSGLPIPEKKQFDKGVILYIKEDKK